MPNFAFSPPDGLRNMTSFPTDPETEAAARDFIQSILDQIATFLNSEGGVINANDLENIRKLSASGNFTGTWMGHEFVQSDPGLVAKVQTNTADIASLGTSKANATDLAATTDTVNTHLNDNTKHIPTGGTVGQVLQKQSNGFGFADLPASKDVDNGRYQAQFGLEDAILINTGLNNSSLTLDSNVSTSFSTSMGNSGIVTDFRGMIITTKKIANKIEAWLASDFTVFAYLVNNQNNTLIANGVISGRLITFDNLNLPIGTYKIVLYYGAGYANNYITGSFPIQTENFDVISSVSGISNYGQNTSTSQYYQFTNITVYCYSNNLTGIAIKKISPNSINKWGNIKWTQSIPSAGSAITCDVFQELNGNSISGPYLPYATTSSGIHGYVIKPKTNLIGVAITLSDLSPDVYRGELVDINTKNILTKFSVSGNNIKIYYPLIAGVEYGIGLVRAESSTGFAYGSATYPYQSADFDIVAGMNNSYSKNYSEGYNIANITALKDNVLKTNIVSTTDISDIDTAQFPIINLRWKLTRSNTTDVSPTIKNTSITWEGESAFSWVKIANVTLLDNTSQIIFSNLNLEIYKYFKLMANIQCTDIGSFGVSIDKINGSKNYNSNWYDWRLNSPSNAASTYSSGNFFLGLNSNSIKSTFEILIMNDFNPLIHSEYVSSYPNLNTGIVNGTVHDNMNPPSLKINSFSLKNGGTNFAKGSTFTLMGVK